MKSISFVRWGNLNPVKHKEHSKKEGFHVAPKKKGIYAFPCGYVERFLIWGSYTDHWNRYIVDDNGNKIKDDGNSSLSDIDFKKLLKKKHIKINDVSSKWSDEDQCWYFVYKLKPKKFEYNGYIWHHLSSYVGNKKEILEEYGDWIKTSMSVYIKALHRCDISERFWASRQEWGTKHGNPHTHPRYCTKDHYEVFIEKL